jgi:hypothetical protein
VVGSNVDVVKRVVGHHEPRARSGDNTMSDFMFLFRAGEADRREAMGTPEQAQKSLQTWLAWIRELEAKGHLKNPGQPLNPGGKVVRGKKRVVTDGPYIEAKELVLGFIIVEARDLAQAVALSTGCPMLEGGGSVEVRPIEVGMLTREV